MSKTKNKCSLIVKSIDVIVGIVRKKDAMIKKSVKKFGWTGKPLLNMLSTNLILRVTLLLLFKPLI